MKQDLIKEFEKKKQEKNPLKQKFDEVTADVIELPATRVVKLVFSSCCGCGCSDVEIKREVPFDSKLKDGDRITKLEKKDKMI